MEVPDFPPKTQVYEWASYVAGRHPQFKLHQHRGQAMNALMYTVGEGPRGGVIYHHEDGEWKVIFTYEWDQTCCECGQKGDLRQPGGRIVIGGSLGVLATRLPGRRTMIPRHLQKTCHYNCRELYKAKHPEEEWAWPKS